MQILSLALLELMLFRLTKRVFAPFELDLPFLVSQKQNIFLYVLGSNIYYFA